MSKMIRNPYNDFDPDFDQDAYQAEKAAIKEAIEFHVQAAERNRQGMMVSTRKAVREAELKAAQEAREKAEKATRMEAMGQGIWA